MPVKGIVFDKDGTLFDFDATWAAWTKQLLIAEAGKGEAFERLADALGFDTTHDRFRPDSIVIAETAANIATRVCSVLPDLEPAALLMRMNTLAAEVPQVQVGDLAAIFAQLRSMDITLAVATNDSEAPARAHLQAAGVSDAFEVIMGSDSGFGGKPAPGQLLQFLSVTGLAAQDCLMVGDSLHDLDAGRAAGMKTVGVLTGPATRDVLTPAADIVLPSIGELPEWIASNA